MLAAVRSAAVLGIDAYAVTVEVDVAQGLPQFTIVGLAASAVKESRERVAAALANSGLVLPPRRITVNLAPASASHARTCRPLGRVGFEEFDTMSDEALRSALADGIAEYEQQS